MASRLFAERGYAGTSLAEIAAGLGIRKPSLYNYYASKDELFVAVFEASIRDWSQATRPALDGEGSFRQRLESHLRSIVSFAVDNPHTLALCREALRNQPNGAIRVRIDELVQRQELDYRRRLRSFFENGVACGEIAPVPVSVLVLSWQTFIDGLISARILELGSLRGQSALDGDLYLELWRLFWRGIAASQEDIA
ncbi:MAG: TetR/AcrR family transcriptional regulator [Acidobacteriota bacterium]